MKRIVVTVTNDLTYDQRMLRTCAALASFGYQVTLVGRRRRESRPLDERPFLQKRLSCYFESGFLFYAAYNLRLFCYLLAQRFDAVCAVDLDTIFPAFLAARIKGAVRIYDAHELFTEMKEVKSRPRVQRFWTRLERFAVRRMHAGYTVNESIAEVFLKRYGRRFDVVRNMPRKKDLVPQLNPGGYLLYQGAVNEARGFEYMIPAMHQIDRQLVICGDGNFMQKLRELIAQEKLEHKVTLLGMLPPEQLPAITAKAWLGLSFIEGDGLSQYLSLTNKWFDYVQSGLPQIACDYPEYRRHNTEFEVALLIAGLSTENLVAGVRRLETEQALYQTLHQNALSARERWTWETEEPNLFSIFEKALAAYGK